MGVVSWLRAVRGGGSGEGGDSEETRESPVPEEPVETAAEEDRGSLFECPSCETVYIAIEMARCSRCDVAVESIEPARPLLAGPK